MGLVVERICAWCLVIVAIFMGFGQAGAERCGGCLKVTREGRFIGKAGSYYVILLYRETYWVYTLKDLIGYLYSLYYCFVLRV